MQKNPKPGRPPAQKADPYMKYNKVIKKAHNSNKINRQTS